MLKPLDPNESDPYILWAEIVKLRSALEGPEGFATWQEAAVSERMRRVRAEKELQALKEKMSWSGSFGMSESELRSHQGTYG